MSKTKAVEPQTKDEVKATIERMLAEHELPTKLEWRGYGLLTCGGEMVASLCEERTGRRFNSTGRIKVLCAAVRRRWNESPGINGRTFKATEKRHLQYEKLIPHLVRVITTGEEVRLEREAERSSRDEHGAAIGRLEERFVLPGGLSMYAKADGIEMRITCDEEMAERIVAAIAEERSG